MLLVWGPRLANHSAGGGEGWGTLQDLMIQLENKWTVGSGRCGREGIPSQRPSAARCPGPVTSAGHETNNSCIPTLWAEGQLGLGMEETHVSAVSLALGRV